MIKDLLQYEIRLLIVDSKPEQKPIMATQDIRLRLVFS